MLQSHFYRKDNTVYFLDQRLLPYREEYCSATCVEEIYDAIIHLKIRGAPLIGIAAAYGLWLACKNTYSITVFTQQFTSAYQLLYSSRPTAVNLTAALERMKFIFDTHKAHTDAGDIIALFRNEADAIYNEDRSSCIMIGDYLQEFIPHNARILTHCNAGELATAQYGTALSGIYTAHDRGKSPFVWVDETRPWFQGARLTTWELARRDIETCLVIDSCAASLMRDKKVDLIIVGADRIAANGDTANKIGTYMLACAAHENKIPFIVAAPRSTWDESIADGSRIVIEERDHDEIRLIQGNPITTRTQKCYNPVFDITPVHLITAHVSELGVMRYKNEH